MPPNKSRTLNPKYRYGIGEWYGKLFSELSDTEREKYARAQFLPRDELAELPCPFRGAEGAEVPCSKKGGVCSIRRYVLDPRTEAVAVAAGKDEGPVTTCPHRFKQDGAIFRWVGEKLLGT